MDRRCNAKAPKKTRAILMKQTFTGVVCLLIQISIMISYNVSILNNTYIKIYCGFVWKTNSLNSVFMSGYVISPDDSSHIVDQHDYFDKLLSQSIFINLMGHLSSVEILI